MHKTDFKEGNNSLSKFLTALFPNLEDEPLRSQCRLARAARAEREELSILSEALIVVGRHGGLETLATKVKREHPTGGDHEQQHDDRVLDCLTEACAFAWSSMRGIGDPAFCDQHGTPDIKLDSGNWIEVKAIRRSEQDDERMGRMLAGEVDSGTVRMPTQGLYRKFDSALNDALKKFCRQNPENSPQPDIVFFNLTTVDVPNIPNTETIKECLARWAEEQEVLLREDEWIRETRLVMCYGYNWRIPFRDPFDPESVQ